MQVFSKAFAGGFAGKVAAGIFLAACALLGVGPDTWVHFIMGSDVSPWAARGVLIALGLITAYALLSAEAMAALVRAPMAILQWLALVRARNVAKTESIADAICALMLMREKSSEFDTQIKRALEQLKPEIEALFADAECRPEGIKWGRLEEATYQWSVALRSAAHAFKECFGEDKEIIRSIYYASEGPLAGEDAMDRRKARRYRQFYDELSYARQPIADIQRRFHVSIADTHKMLSDHGRKVIRGYQP